MVKEEQESSEVEGHQEPEAAAAPAAGPDVRPRWRRPFLVACLVVMGLAVGIVTALFLTGSGDLGAIADPASPALAEMHAEAAGIGAGTSVPIRGQTVIQLSGLMGRFADVTYKVQTGGTVADVARIYGMPVEDLQQLNPRGGPDRFLGAGQEVVVYKAGVALADVPKGARARLHNGVPMPDGPGRRIRRRSLSWGAAHVVASLDRALTAYGRAFPDGPVVIVSDMSRREGGRLYLCDRAVGGLRLWQTYGI